MRFSWVGSPEIIYILVLYNYYMVLSIDKDNGDMVTFNFFIVLKKSRDTSGTFLYQSNTKLNYKIFSI